MNVPADGFEPMPQVFLRLAELSEEQHLRRGIVLLKLLKLCHERVGLGVGRNGVEHLDQPLQLCGFLSVGYRDIAQQGTDEFVLSSPSSKSAMAAFVRLFSEGAAELRSSRSRRLSSDTRSAWMLLAMSFWKMTMTKPTA